MNKENIIGLSRNDLLKHFQELDIPKFRVQQVWNWLYHHGVWDFERMANLSLALRQQLRDQFVIVRPQVAEAQISTDGTQKWLLRFSDGQEAETVHIPEPDRGTLCISSQVGCTLTCKFCHTGTQRLVRNLTSSEIVGQLMVARDIFGEWPAPLESRRVSNIVMMGMGEPLYNYKNVRDALKILMDPDGILLSRKRITLSTSGVVPFIKKCGQELGINLAISLHAVRNDLRNILVPLNKKYPIEELLKVCQEYPAVSKTHRVTFEYVMLKDVNDSNADAKELVRLIKGIPAKINLIPFNPWPGSSFECSSPTRISAFADIIYKAGYVSPIRTPRGQDIWAACGQLKSRSTRERKSKLETPHLPASL